MADLRVIKMKQIYRKISRSFMMVFSILAMVSFLAFAGYALWHTPLGPRNGISQFLLNAVKLIFDNIPLLFAVGIPLGSDDNKDGLSALTGLICYLIIRNLNSFAITGTENVLLGILIGAMVTIVNEKFSGKEPPEYLVMFSGRKLVPMLSIVITLFISALLYLNWPTFNKFLMLVGRSVMDSGLIGAGLYGFLNRILIPTGMHHTLNSAIWFNAAGINDMGRYWTNTGIDSITGIYMAGFFPVMMFGLPGACLAIYSTAQKKYRSGLRKAMFRMMASSFVLGLTEPIEFLFISVSPVLFIVHAVLTGLSLAVAAYLKTSAGFTFSAGLIDFLLSMMVPGSRKPLVLLGMGVIFFLVYFIVFRILILKLDIRTIGRREKEEHIIEKDKKDTDITEAGSGTLSDYASAKGILEGLGGEKNIEFLENCATRLRLEVRDLSEIDRDKIKASGAIEVIHTGENKIHVILGQRVQYIAEIIKNLMDK